jgi:hypothetical protein
VSAFATLPAEERELFFRQYQERRGVDPVIAEKDFWVCWLLGRIFEQPDLADMSLFKGGTSLSKVFHVIERFSEDIDLGITPASLGWKESDLDEAPSRTKRDERNARLEIACATAVENVWKPRLEQVVQAVLGRPLDRAGWLTFKIDEVSRSPLLLFAYPGALPRGVAYIAREVKMEFGSLTDQRPTGSHPIQAFVGDLVPGAFTDCRTSVVALELERTFWEKVTILHAEFHRPADRLMRDRHARHYADVAALWNHEPAKAARSRLDLLERVRIHKSRFFPSSWANYASAIPGSLRLVPPDHRIEALRADYAAMQQMFLNAPMPFDQVLATLREAEAVLNRS